MQARSARANDSESFRSENWIAGPHSKLRLDFDATATLVTDKGSVPVSRASVPKLEKGVFGVLLRADFNQPERDKDGHWIIKGLVSGNVFGLTRFRRILHVKKPLVYMASGENGL